MAFVLLGVSTTNVEAKTKKKKTRATTSYVSSDKKKKNKKNKNKKNRMAKSRRYKRSGTGPDLRALTTEQPDAEYIQNPDNGVNAVETKSEL
jgi:hypothetical protein